MLNFTDANIVSDGNGIMVNAGVVNVSGGHMKAVQYGIGLMGRDPNQPNNVVLNMIGGPVESIWNVSIGGNGGAMGVIPIYDGTAVNVSRGIISTNQSTSRYVSCSVYNSQYGTVSISGDVKIVANNSVGILMCAGELSITGKRS